MKYLFSALLIVLALGCKTVPTEQLFQATTQTKITFDRDTIYLYFDNPLRCPIRYYVKSKDSTIQSQIKPLQPLTLYFRTDTLVKIPAGSKAFKSVSLGTAMGDPEQAVYAYNFKLSLPFQQGKSYKIIQGHGGNYSHNDDYSKYAIDFDMKIGDTVCAAADGYVVGVIKDYKYGGPEQKWRNYANFITIYHPSLNLFTQYVHLSPNSSFVTVGDLVQVGAPIGLSGKTGWTDVAHLHFNVLAPVAGSEELKSVPINFIEGYSGKDLDRNETVKKPVY
jgi:murein DD-endopeptidase MepM/ murein hydrolase activator NlpD